LGKYGTVARALDRGGVNETRATESRESAQHELLASHAQCPTLVHL
jgi:hypothetical protein